MRDDSVATQAFLEHYFEKLPDSEAILSSLSTSELSEADDIYNSVVEKFATMKYILGLALDFLLLCELLSKHDTALGVYRPTDQLQDVWSKFPLKERVGQRDANTLTVAVAQTASALGIRKIEEHVVNFFHKQMRTGYPSAYVYNTGQWKKFENLFLKAYRLSSLGRLFCTRKLIDYGLSNITKNTFWTRPVERARLFDIMLSRYPRTQKGENGGLALQAIAYGFFKADRPHLDFVVDKVRTGSSRQNRFGDIDAYSGADLELTSEVKDIYINKDNFEKQCRQFVELCKTYRINGIVLAANVDEHATSLIQQDGCTALTIAEVKRIVSLWDWPKQDRSFNSVLHYLAHIEQNADAAKRLITFARSFDPTHSSLAFADV